LTPRFLIGSVSSVKLLSFVAGMHTPAGVKTLAIFAGSPDTVFAVDVSATAMCSSPPTTKRRTPSAYRWSTRSTSRKAKPVNAQ
jgi:hypothetical protein